MGFEDCFDENLQAHQSVDSRNRIITFLFKWYTDAFLSFEFFNSLPWSMQMYLWHPVVLVVLVVLKSYGLLWTEKSDIYPTAYSSKYYNPVSIFLSTV